MEKIILGLGNNIDYEVAWDSKMIEKMIVLHDIRDEELSANISVDSERSLLISILGFLKSGMGGERFVSSSEIIENFVKNFEYKVTLGGTSVRAAIAMRKLGYTSALHLVTMNDDVRRLIPADSPYVCSGKIDSCYPHLIIQFNKGVSIKAADIDLCAARSNRIIYDNDQDNFMMQMDEGLVGLIADAKIFLISGFNAMQSEPLLRERLQTLIRIMEKLPKDACVYYEDGCFHNREFSKIVQDMLIDFIDVYSMNEDELQEYLGRQLELIDTELMIQALEEIHEQIPARTIVLHTQYYALAYGEKATDYAKALKSGITMAGTRFCYGDDFTVEDYEKMERHRLQDAGIKFAQEIKGRLADKICCIPCFQIDETSATTIGLGDSFVGGFLPALLP